MEFEKVYEQAAMLFATLFGFENVGIVPLTNQVSAVFCHIQKVNGRICAATIFPRGYLDLHLYDVVVPPNRYSGILIRVGPEWNAVRKVPRCFSTSFFSC